jgi:hypothetical protein
MSETLKHYWDALDRLIAGKTVRVAIGTKIHQASVSLEAGREKGSIKNSRPVFKELIDAIDTAASTQDEPINDLRGQLEQAKAEAGRYRILWEEALAREVSLVMELWATRETSEKEQEATLSGKVTQLQKPKP